MKFKFWKTEIKILLRKIFNYLLQRISLGELTPCCEHEESFILETLEGCVAEEIVNLLLILNRRTIINVIIDDMYILNIYFEK